MVLEISRVSLFSVKNIPFVHSDKFLIEFEISYNFIVRYGKIGIDETFKYKYTV